MSDFIFPRPRDWETLEDIACDIFSYEFQNSNLQRYGRRGQRQHGVDIAGMEEKNTIVGIQCKHLTEKDITMTEIDKEIKKAEKFSPALSKYLLVTSAKSETKIISHVLKITKERQKKGFFSVEIKFWGDIERLLQKYPDLMFRYFTKNLPIQKSENIIIPDAQRRRRETFSFPAKKKLLQQKITENLQIEKVDPYNISVGVTSFKDVSFSGVTDLQLQLEPFFSNTNSPAENFKEAAKILNKLKETVSDPFFSKNLTIHMNSRLSLAFLMGRVFRKVTGFNLTLISGNQIWATNNLPIVPSGVTDSFPIINPKGNKEAVFTLNVGRDISESVKKFVSNWDQSPSTILSYSVEGKEIKNAAHALSVATDVAHKLKNLKDQWGMKKIHFFGAIPASLATLITYHLNSICPLRIYFMDQAKEKYVLGGEINNNL